MTDKEQYVAKRPWLEMMGRTAYIYEYSDGRILSSDKFIGDEEINIGDSVWNILKGYGKINSFSAYSPRGLAYVDFINEKDNLIGYHYEEDGDDEGGEDRTMRLDRFKKIFKKGD